MLAGQSFAHMQRAGKAKQHVVRAGQSFGTPKRRKHVERALQLIPDSQLRQLAVILSTRSILQWKKPTAQQTFFRYLIIVFFMSRLEAEGFPLSPGLIHASVSLSLDGLIEIAKLSVLHWRDRSFGVLQFTQEPTEPAPPKEPEPPVVRPETQLGLVIEGLNDNLEISQARPHSSNPYWHYDQTDSMSLFYTACEPPVSHCATKLCSLEKAGRTTENLGLHADGISDLGKVKNPDEIANLDGVCVQPHAEEIHLLSLGPKSGILHRGPTDSELEGTQLRLLLAIDENVDGGFQMVYHEYGTAMKELLKEVK